MLEEWLLGAGEEGGGWGGGRAGDGREPKDIMC